MWKVWIWLRSASIHWVPWGRTHFLVLKHVCKRTHKYIWRLRLWSSPLFWRVTAPGVAASAERPLRYSEERNKLAYKTKLSGLNKKRITYFILIYLNLFYYIIYHLNLIISSNCNYLFFYKNKLYFFNFNRKRFDKKNCYFLKNLNFGLLNRIGRDFSNVFCSANYRGTNNFSQRVRLRGFG